MFPVKSATRPTTRGPMKDEDYWSRSQINERFTQPRDYEIRYTYLIGDGEQAVPSGLLPGRDDLSVQSPRVALECAVQRAEIYREHEHFLWGPQAPSCAVRREQPDDAVERNRAGGDDE